MSNIKSIGHSAFLILFNWIIFLTVKSDAMYFKGVIAVGGIGKDVGTFGILLFLFYLYIDQYFIKEYNLYLKNKKIIFLYFISPLFILWILMNFYLFSISKLLEYIDDLNYFILLYFILCFVLLYFQNRLIIKFEMIKNDEKS